MQRFCKRLLAHIHLFNHNNEKHLKYNVLHCNSRNNPLSISSNSNQIIPCNPVYTLNVFVSSQRLPAHDHLFHNDDTHKI